MIGLKESRRIVYCWKVLQESVAINFSKCFNTAPGNIMRNQAYFLIPAAAVTLSILTPGLRAQTLFSENFDTDTSGLWTVNSAAVNSTGNNAVFAFDYSTVGIPAAPGS